MAQITLQELAGGFRQMTAPAGYCLTQAAVADEHERMFVRVRLLLCTEQITDWRLASDAEAAEHERRMEERNTR